MLPCESAPGLICEVLETEPACEKATLHVPDHASWDVEAKDGGLDGLRSPFTNCSIVSYSTNRLTGTDGFRLLCHQFFPSSLPLPENCLTSSTTFSLKRNKLREALLLFYNIGGQGQETRQMGYPLQHGLYG